MAIEFAHSPALTFLLGLAVVVFLLVYLKLPAFIGLIISAFTVGLINSVFVTDFALGDAASETATAFGNGMTGIGIPILMAAIIGKAMLESGAAQRIVRGFQSLVSDENTDIALWGSSFFIAIPVFFDNVFYLLAPLARSARARVGKNYTLFIVAIGAGGAATHVFVPPTPGPLAVADQIDVALGPTILAGIITALPTAALAGIVYGRWINKRVDVPLRDTMATTTDELQEITERPTSALPGMIDSLAPILLAVLLIGSQTAISTFQEWVPALEVLAPYAEFFGDRNVGLTIAALAAAYTYYRYSDLDLTEWSDELTEALKSGGNIAAITAAGGAFGVLLAASGIGPYIAGGLEELGIGLLITAWLIAAAVRIAQGSATAAMLTTAGIMAPLTPQLTVHPAYLVMVIGAGGNIASWFNDSGFWLVSEIGGLTKMETLKTWTVLTTIIAVSGLIWVLIVSTLFPMA